MGKQYIIIPIFNEGKVILEIVSTLLKKKYRVILVDDGSTDQTSLPLKSNNLIIIKHAINRGKGAAIKTGMQAAKILDADSVITFDGDGQHSIDDIPTLQKKLQQKIDVVLGYREFVIQYMPLSKILGNKIANILTKILYGVTVRDSQCGLRAYSHRALHIIDTYSDDYGFDTEVIREIKRHNLSYTEVPIKTTYTHYTLSKQTKQTPFNGIKMFYRIILSQ
jgi:glycosyltransferase involved in cell wall biosynthesis